MENMSKIPKEIRVVFPRPKDYEAHLPQDLSQHKGKKFYDLFEVDINDLLTWFKGFGIEHIELFINSIINSNDRAKLIVGSTQDQKGVKLFLKPNGSKAIEPQLHKGKNSGAD